ncbi:hypothetical protein RAZWK3B_12609 [Roseobacter sp. AzwK-3b]|nr:hypothetical protein RAZWK3B_12609 [Roseobacter sp. AzwK-3b]
MLHQFHYQSCPEHEHTTTSTAQLTAIGHVLFQPFNVLELTLKLTQYS